MLTKWEYSPELEAQRLLHAAHYIATGFYKLNGFYPLPYPSLTADNIVSFPDLPYLSIPRFWQKCGQVVNTNLPISAPSDLIRDTQKLLAGFQLAKPDHTQIQKDWAKIESKVIQEIYRLIPSRKNAIKKIVIWPMAFGTSCSFNVLDDKPGAVYLWLRYDQGVASIVEAILSSLTRHDVYANLHGLWQESEIIVDWLLTYSPLSKILPNSNSTLTIKATRSVQNATLVQQSQKFLQHLGVPNVNIDTIKNIPQDNFTAREREIMQLLLSRSPAPVTMDNLGDILFKDNLDAYSEYAIAKTIQRLRDKLEASGVSGSYIQTKRGEGYLLVS